MTEEISSQALEQTTDSNLQSVNTVNKESTATTDTVEGIDIDIPPVVLKSIQVARSGPRKDEPRNDRTPPDERDLYPRMPVTDLFERRSGSDGRDAGRERVIAQLSDPDLAETEIEIGSKAAAETEPNKDDITPSGSDEDASEETPPIKLEKYRPASIRVQEGRKGRFPTKHNKYAKPFRISFDGLVRHFAACPRCSYFLTGLRALYGDNLLVETLNEMEDGWLPMPWNIETRRLLNRSYGIRTDVGYFFIEHSCDACQRRIVYESLPDGLAENPDHLIDPQEYFWIEIKARR